MGPNPNHPYVVWSSCFLWLTSLFTISWSLALFYCMGDMLLITGTDLVLAVALLSGIIMLPTNLYMLYIIANGKTVEPRGKVLCCPLWMLIVWITLVNCLGVAVCIQKICVVDTAQCLKKGMKQYRSVPKYKSFMDNLQWSLKCCGMDSYKDWFHQDWYEKIRDYEWNPSQKKLVQGVKKESPVSDSVPLSCCKSGTCVPNYLLELGTRSINTNGCNKTLYHIYMLSMCIHLIIFFLIVVAQITLLTCIFDTRDCETDSKRKISFDVKHLMPVNKKFLQSGSSTESICPRDELSDVEESVSYQVEAEQPVPY